MKFMLWKFLRGIDCGLTNVSLTSFIEQLKKLKQSEFRPEDYKLFENNCRDFCYYLIFNIFNPSKKEQGWS